MSKKPRCHPSISSPVIISIIGLALAGVPAKSISSSSHSDKGRRIRQTASGATAHAATFRTTSAKVVSSRETPMTSSVSVLTQHNDNLRTGANLGETVLNTSNTNVTHFGKLFSRSVDGYVYAQPLYVPGLDIPGKGTHNVVYAATEHNSVYAYDADDPNAQVPLWQVNLGTPVPTSDIAADYSDLKPEIGITSTPVIDLGSNTIYVVAKTKELDGTYHQTLHALDISTGSERPSSPVEITASVSGSGSGSTNGIVRLVRFEPLLQLNRPGLLLMNGIVYVAFGSHGDIGDYHGWVFGYTASSLQLMSVFNTTPDGTQGSVWQAGSGLATDGSSIYLATGNGTFDFDQGGRDCGDSVLKLSPVGGLSIADWFTPSNQSDLNYSDADLGSGGPLLIPRTSLLVVCGKDGLLRLVDTNGMGNFDPATDHDLQEFQAVSTQFFGSPVYWDRGNNGTPQIYLWASGDFLKAFSFDGSLFDPTPVSLSSMGAASGFVAMSLSASADQPGSGIVWACVPSANSGAQVPGILRAFDAGNPAVELWNSQQNQARDNIGNYAKFCPPTVANGKVYVASFSGQLHVFGLLPDTCSLSISAPSALFASAQSWCPFATSTPVNYATPTATSDCTPATVSCNPPSGSIFSVGTTTVTCTAADGAGNTTQGSFPVNVFSLCLQDDAKVGNVAFVNALTGDYLFCSGGAAIASGRGTLTVSGCSFDIDHTKGNRKVHIHADTSDSNGNGAGTASITKGTGQIVVQITDSDMANRICSCSR